MRSLKAATSNNGSSRRLTLLHLVCAAALFSLVVFVIQSSFFAGSSSLISLYLRHQFLNIFAKILFKTSGYQQPLADLNKEEVRILSDFQSSIQQCVVCIMFSFSLFLSYFVPFFDCTFAGRAKELSLCDRSKS